MDLAYTHKLISDDLEVWNRVKITAAGTQAPEGQGCGDIVL